jgi:extracellular elastinolytic metalloproteinase
MNWHGIGGSTQKARRTGPRALMIGVVAALVLATTGLAGSGGNRVSKEGSKGVAGVERGAFFDIRETDEGRQKTARVPLRVERAQAALRTSLGRFGVVQVDEMTGTPRVVARLNGFLTRPSRRDPARIVLDYVAGHPSVFRLGKQDLGRLRPVRNYTDIRGTHHLTWAQTYRGIPVFDNDLRGNVARDGRLVNVLGSPLRRVLVPSVEPTRSARDAVAAAYRHAGATVPPLHAVGHRDGSQRATRFSDGSRAKLVIFGERGGARLAWRVTVIVSSVEDYAYLVDATDGTILWRANMVAADRSGKVWEEYPTNLRPAGVGSQTVKSFPGWDGTTLVSNRAHTYADVRDQIPAIRKTPRPGPYAHADSGGDEIPPSSAAALEWHYDFQGNTTTPARNCTASWACSWNSDGAPWNWEANLRQSATQTHYFVNRFHDHLLAAPIGFTEAAGNFQTVNSSAACKPPPPNSTGCKGGDAVLVEVFDGAGKAYGEPDVDHHNNASMDTPADGDGFAPRMQLYLWMHTGTEPDGNGGDSAAVVYHEYTHGMSHRLVAHDSTGTPALNSEQSAAMGEGWSDWYAEDFLVGEGYDTDAAAAGDVQFEYFLGGGRTIRTEPMDCPVTPSASCSGTPGAGSGGYTYGDLGHVGPAGEAHDDAEIWSQTLWQLRQRLIAAHGPANGVERARSLITRAMELSPPDPSFLDMRNAILQADVTNDGGADRNLIWDVFANRGMGWFASTSDGDDPTPVEDFSLPTTGTSVLTGSLEDVTTGARIPGALVEVGAHPSGVPDSLSATTNSVGVYRILGLAPQTYRHIAASAPGYERSVVASATLGGGGGVTVLDFDLRRDWAAESGTAAITSSSGTDNSQKQCGPRRAFDLSERYGWSSNETTAPSVTLQLPTAVDIDSFQIDPKYTTTLDCAHDLSSALHSYKIETSKDGTTWDVSNTGPDFTLIDIGHLNGRSPAANTDKFVRFVRFSMLGNQQTATTTVRTVDISEFEIYGQASQPPVAAGLKKFVGLVNAAEFDAWLYSVLPVGTPAAAVQQLKQKYGTLVPQIGTAIDKAVADAGGDIATLDAKLDDLDGNGDPTIDFVAGGSSAASGASASDVTAGPLVLDLEGTISPHAVATSYDIGFTVKAKLNLDDLFRVISPAIKIEKGTVKDTLEFSFSGAFKLNTQLGGSGFQLEGNDVKVATPRFKVEADFGSTDPTIGGDTSPISFAIGPLGVTGKGAVKADAGVDVFMKDPNQDGHITLNEMTSTSPSKLFHFSCASGGAHLALNVSAGLKGLVGQVGTVSLDDTNLCNGVPAPTVTLNKLGDFRSLTPAQLINGLAQITQALRTIQETYDLKVPFVQKTLADVTRFNERLVKFFVDNGLTDPKNPLANVELGNLGNVDTLTKLAPLLTSALGISESVLNLRYENGQLLFDVRLTRDPPSATASGLIEVGDELKQVGLVSLKGSGQTSIDPKYDLSLTVGTDLTAPAGTDLAKRVYFRTDGVELTADGVVTADLNLTGRLEPLAATVSDTNPSGPVTLLHRRDSTKPMLSVDLQGYGDNRLTLAELADSFTKTIPAANVTVNASVPPTGLSAKLLLGTTQLAGGALTMKWPDVTKLSGPDALAVIPDATYANGPLQLAFTQDPLVLLRLLLQASRDASDLLAKLLDSKPVFANTLPVIGGTPRELVPFLAQLRQSLDELLADNLSLTLPGLQAALQSQIAKTFGLTAAQAASILKLRYEPAASGKRAALVLEINLGLCTKVLSGQTARCATPTLPRIHRAFNVRLGGANDDVPSIVGLSTNGTVDLDVDAGLKLAFGVELPAVARASSPSAFPSVSGTPRAVLLDSTSLSAGLGADVSGQLASEVGPLRVSLGNTAAGDPASGYLRARVRLKDPTADPANPRRFVIPSTDLTLFLNRLLPTTLHESAPFAKTCGGTAADACLRLPLYLGSTKLTTNPITFKAPNLLAPTGWTFSGVTELLAKLKSGKLDWALALEGIEALAKVLEDSLANVPPGTKLPLVGADVSSGAKVVQDFRTNVLIPFKTAFATFNSQATAGNLRAKLQAFFMAHIGPLSTGKLLRPTPVGLKAAVAAGNVATFTTVEPHGFIVGQKVTIEGVEPAGYDGAWKIASTPSASTFTASIGATPAPGTAFGTAASFRPVPVRLTCKAATGEKPCEDDDLVTSIVRAEISLPLGKQVEVSAQPFDIGFDGLRLESEGTLAATARWAADLTFGIDRTEGFYFASQNPVTAGEPELRLETGVDFPRAIRGELAFIPIGIADGHAGPDAALRLGVDLGGGGLNKRIGIDQLKNFGKPTGWTLASTFAGCVNAKLAIQTTGVGAEPARLPSILANLGLAGGYDCPEGGLGTGAPATTADGFKAGFTDVRLDIGSWFRDFLAPALDTVNDTVAPLRPAIRAIRQPIPAVADLARGVGMDPSECCTWYELLRKYNEVQKLAGKGDQLSLIDRVVALVDLVSVLDSVSASGTIPLGSFQIDTIRARKLQADPSILLKDVLPADSVIAQIAQSSLSAAAKKAVEEATTKGGFTFPAFQDPKLLFGLLLGKDPTLVAFDAGKLHAEQGIRFSFPAGPVILSIGGNVSADGRFVAGFDTFGVRQALKILTDGDPSNDGFLGVTGSLLQGLYVDDRNKDDVDVPEIVLGANATVGATLGASIEGGIDANVDVNLHVESADGKLRYPEVHKVLTTPPANPVCLFDASGRVGASVAVVIPPFPPFPLRIPIAQTTVYEMPDLTKFCHPQSATGIGTLLGSTLLVKASENADKVKLAKVGEGRVSVDGPFGDHIFTGVDDVYVDGRGGDDSITVVGDGVDVLPWDIPLTLCGGAGDDKLTGGPSVDELWGDGGGHVVTSTTVVMCSSGEGNDVLVGNGGFDTFHGGKGNDWLFGDGADVPSAGRPGADYLSGGAGDDFIRGGPGSDTLSGGSGPDTADFSDRAAVLTIDLAAGKATGSSETDVVNGIENVRGGASGDTIKGTDAEENLDGGGGNDTVDGGKGNDKVVGGAGNDVLRGGDGDDELLGSDGNDRLVDGLGNDKDRGLEGSDTYDQGPSANGGDTLTDEGVAGGTDKVDWSTRTKPVSSTTDGLPNDGEAGEGDNVAADIEQAAFVAAQPASSRRGVRPEASPAPLHRRAGKAAQRALPALPPACTFASTTATVGIKIPALLGSGVTQTAVLKRAGAAIQMNGSNCGAATVNNTDRIVVTGAGGAQKLIVDESAGLFAPGKSPETTGLPEIEFSVNLGSTDDTASACPRAGSGEGDNLEVVGTGAADKLRAGDGSGGTLQVNVNGDADADIVGTSIETGVLDGAAGPDELSGEGGPGAGSRLTSGADFLTLAGGAGNDRLASGELDTCFYGGPGNDTEVGSGRTDVFYEDAAPNGADRFVAGGGPFDAVLYNKRTTPVVVSLDGSANDGAVGEHDFLDGVRWGYVLGGSANDAMSDKTGAYERREFQGGLGADTLVGGIGGDTLWGCYSGRYVKSAAFQSCTTDGSDTLSGGDQGDDIYGQAGNDKETGGPGPDRFSWSSYAGPAADSGADDIRGGDGGDTMSYSDSSAPIVVTMADNLANDGVAGEHDNVHSDVENLYGANRAPNTVTGNASDNGIHGGLEKDLLTGGSGNDTIDVGGGSPTVGDELHGGLGNDTLLGSDAADKLFGETGDDHMDGDDGADLLYGGPGNDLMKGDYGDDVFKEEAAANGADEMQGRQGDDTVDYVARTTSLKATIDTGPTSSYPYWSLGNDGAVGERDNITWDTENILGGSAADALSGSEPNGSAGVTGANFLAGNAGVDTLNGLGGDDVIDGGAAADNLIGGAGADTVSYQSKKVRVVVSLDGVVNDGEDANGDGVSEEKDKIGTAFESIRGGAGNDVLVGNTGPNTLDGDSGHDLLLATATATTTSDGPDRMIGGEGTDTVSYAARTTSLVVKLDGAANDGEDANHDGVAEEGDNVDASVDILIGGKADDVLVGSDLAQIIKGGPGNDRLDGGLGADKLLGEAGGDTVFYASHARDVVATLDGLANDGEDLDHNGASEESDHIGSDVENLEGGKGNDRLTGDADLNVLDGADGNDLLDGRLGPDVLEGGSGTDTATYVDRTSPIAVTIDAVANDGTVGEDDSVSLDVEGVIGGTDNDKLTGSAAQNSLEGRSGADVLVGGAGDDTLGGGEGDDTLDEGAAANGGDVLAGGGGTDLAQYSARTNPLTVSLDGFTGDGESGERDNVLPDVEDVVTGSGNDVVSGGTPDNVLDGGTGDDRLSGAAGADILLGRLGADTLSGDSGQDVLDQGVEADGGDRVDGGPGLDMVDYSQRLETVLVSLNSTADDGVDADGDGIAEESDNVGIDVEIVLGGSGNDRLVGSDSTNDRLFGDQGDDTVDGGRGNDRLFGGPGNDTLTGGPGCPFGQTCSFADADVVQGGDGDDSLVGGFGSDVIEGDDGNDAIRSKDGKPDTVNGGEGVDRAADFDPVLDSLNEVEALCPPSCG